MGRSSLTHMAHLRWVCGCKVFVIDALLFHFRQDLRKPDCAGFWRLIGPFRRGPGAQKVGQGFCGNVVIVKMGVWGGYLVTLALSLSIWKRVDKTEKLPIILLLVWGLLIVGQSGECYPGERRIWGGQEVVWRLKVERGIRRLFTDCGILSAAGKLDLGADSGGFRFLADEKPPSPSRWKRCKKLVFRWQALCEMLWKWWRRQTDTFSTNQQIRLIHWILVDEQQTGSWTFIWV